ncbi:SDR family oxidoreductase [Granulicella sp. dw_53]|uniref:SDR family oxidoreductase n=1 Tax=Granulicella sp. dw_53 TaxID=2719792 RepID=UPI001BD4F82A|nr:SDR family oxidoreductase [Granulicella sp. dw_53]
MKLQNKNALITGGDRGVGLATARLFIDEGAKVIITGKDRLTLDAAAQQLGPNALALQSDITRSSERKELFKAVAEHLGKLDIVFANTSSGQKTALGETTEELFEQVLNINLTSVFFIVQSALPLLRDQASIILHGSSVATLGHPGYSAFAAGKAGIRAIARTLVGELSPRAIRVNTVVSGAILPITPELAGEVADRITGRIPLARWADASEIAQAVLFLASSDASYMQGTEVIVDGGATSAPFSGPASRI